MGWESAGAEEVPNVRFFRLHLYAQLSVLSAFKLEYDTSEVHGGDALLPVILLYEVPRRRRAHRTHRIEIYVA